MLEVNMTFPATEMQVVPASAAVVKVEAAEMDEMRSFVQLKQHHARHAIGASTALLRSLCFWHLMKMRFETPSTTFSALSHWTVLHGWMGCSFRLSWLSNVIPSAKRTED